jgi:hypothetical protein
VNQAAIVIAMLGTVAATVYATRLARDVGFAVVASAASVAYAVFAFLGVDLSLSTSVASPILLVVGYAALAVVYHQAGLTAKLAARLRPGPLGVLVLAAAASAVLSNDVVIVAFAAVVLARPTRVVDAAALYIGANVTGGLLPQGSPANLLLLGDRAFASYLAVSVPVTAAMLAVAVAGVYAIGRLGLGAPPAGPGGPGSGPAVEAWTTTDRALGGVGVVAIAAQPVCDLLGVSRGVLGWVLIGVAAALAAALGQPLGRTIAQAPWQIVAVAAVVATGAAAVAAGVQAEQSLWGWAATTFFVAGAGTDLLAAALAAPDVAAGAHPAGVGLVAVTAGAFATPIASISGILLLAEHQLAGVAAKAATFALAGAVAVACFAAGTAVGAAVAG